MSIAKGIAILLLVSLPLSIFSQADTLETLTRMCQQFLDEEQLVLADTNYRSDKVGTLFSQPMAEWVQLRSRYFARLGYQVEATTQRRFVPVITDTLLGCRLIDKGVPGAVLTIDPDAAGWLITGIDGELIGEADLRQMDSLLDAAKGIVREKENIYEVVHAFIGGRNALFLNGDSVPLAGTTTPEYLEILKIGKEADQVEEISGKEFAVKALFSDWIQGDTATCLLSLKNFGNVVLRLARFSEEWKVCGEKDFFASPEMVWQKRQELEILQGKAALREALKAELGQAMVRYLQDDEPDLLRQLSTVDFFTFMEKFKRKFGAYDHAYLQVEGPMIPINLDTKVRMKGDSAAVQNLEESVYFLRENGQWKFAGFNGKFGKELNDAFVEAQFFNLKDEFQVSYSAFNGDLAVIELPEPGEEDPTLYHYMTDLLDRATFPDGPESLWEYLLSQGKNRKGNAGRKPGYVYLSFIVEKGGSLSHIEVLKSSACCKGKRARKVVGSMPPWNPAMQDEQAVKSYQVLVVPVR